MMCSTVHTRAVEVKLMHTFTQSVVLKKEIKITISENVITVENAPVRSRLEIYSVVGLKVKDIELKEKSGEYHLDLAKGYYIIRVADTVRKIVIR